VVHFLTRFSSDARNLEGPKDAGKSPKIGTFTRLLAGTMQVAPFDEPAIWRVLNSYIGSPICGAIKAVLFSEVTGVEKDRRIGDASSLSQ
jgi:hypothetical protein